MAAYFSNELFKKKLESTIGSNYQEVIIKSGIVGAEAFRKWTGNSMFKRGPRVEAQKKLSDFIWDNYNVRLNWNEFYVSEVNTDDEGEGQWDIDKLRDAYALLKAENVQLRKELDEKNRFINELSDFFYRHSNNKK